MSVQIPDEVDRILPDEDEMMLAREAQAAWAALALGRGKAVHLQVVDEGGTAASVAVPAVAFRLFLRVLGEVSRGNAARVDSIPPVLTPGEAAAILNVPLRHLATLLEERKIPFHEAGGSRRIKLDDLLAYRKEEDARRAKFADELTALSQEFGGMGY